MKKISIISATDGANLKLAEKIFEASKEYDVEFKVVKLTDFDLPLFTPNEESKNGVPADAVKLYEVFKHSDGFIFVAPEYNGSTPPIFNNALAWVSRSGDKGWRNAFNEKPAVIATHSGGGGIHLLEVMQSQLSFIGIDVIARKIHTTYSKELNQESLSAALNQLCRYVDI